MRILQLIFESVFVGIGLLVLFVPAHHVREADDKDEKNYWLYLKIFMVGAIFHIVGDYTGLNKWYCNRIE